MLSARSEPGDAPRVPMTTTLRSEKENLEKVVRVEPPTLPQVGTITSFSSMDGIGRIRLEDGTELKVGAASKAS